jgi:hypothetical protein
VNSPDIKTKAVLRHPHRAALNWVDYLVIAAIALTVAAIVTATRPHLAQAQPPGTIIPAAELPAQDAPVGAQPDMIKARLGLVLARP